MPAVHQPRIFSVRLLYIIRKMQPVKSSVAIGKSAEICRFCDLDSIRHTRPPLNTDTQHAVSKLCIDYVIFVISTKMIVTASWNIAVNRYRTEVFWMHAQSFDQPCTAYWASPSHRAGHVTTDVDTPLSFPAPRRHQLVLLLLPTARRID